MPVGDQERLVLIDYEPGVAAASRKAEGFDAFEARFICSPSSRLRDFTLSSRDSWSVCRLWDEP